MKTPQTVKTVLFNDVKLKSHLGYGKRRDVIKSLRDLGDDYSTGGRSFYAVDLLKALVCILQIS